MSTRTPTDPLPHNGLTIERALKPNGAEVYTIEVGTTHAAVITGAAALANMSPTDWLLRAIGERIADEAGIATREMQPPPESVN